MNTYMSIIKRKHTLKSKIYFYVPDTESNKQMSNIQIASSNLSYQQE